MEIENNTKIGEIVRHNFKTAQLFEEHGIDFCCGGDISLSEACKSSNTDIDKLIDEIEAQMKVSDSESRYIDQLELGQLCEYIINRHHGYVNDTVPFLLMKLQKLCEVHGSAHPELFSIKEHFETMAGNLALHMKKEELSLFPLVQKIEKFHKNGGRELLEAGKLQNTIAELEGEHQAEGERLAAIEKLSNNYTVPPDGCNTFEVTFRTLKEFEQDLHRHIHLENNVLFKKAIRLEKNKAK